MALQSGQLVAALSVNGLSIQLTGLSAAASNALPGIGAIPQSMGLPTLIDGEFMYIIAQPVSGTYTLRGRGTESAAAVHDILANVYFSNQPGDFPVPQPGTSTTIDPAEDGAVSIGQDQTLVLPGATTVYNINKASAAAVVVPAPSLGDNGVTYTFTSNTAFAHALTMTGLIQDGTTSVPKTTATFTAAKGATVTFLVENGLFNVSGSPLGVTFT